MATTIRFRSARLTRALIIEQNPALHDDALAALEPARDYGLVAFLERDLDPMRLEHPRLDFDEHLIVVLLENERVRRRHRHGLAAGAEGRVGEHVRLEAQV